MERREFMIAAGIVTTAIAFDAVAHTVSKSDKKIKAILFDGFPIFNPAPVYKLTLELFPDKGNELAKQWRTTQFEYTWLRTLSGSYKDFIGIIDDALVYAAAATGVAISDEQRGRLVNAWYQLDVWPEVPSVLQQLKNAGYRLGILSNFTPKMLAINSDNHHLLPFFEQLISVDAVKKYKPAPETYRQGIRALSLKEEEILFVPFAGWDASGAKQFGYKTYWINRLRTPPEELGVMADGMGKDMNDLPMYLKQL